MNKKITTLLLALIISITIFVMPVFAYFNAQPLLDLAKNNLSIGTLSANDGMQVAALRMCGGLTPMDEKATEYLWAVHDAISAGNFVVTADAIIGVTAAGVSAETFMDGVLIQSLATECKSATNPSILADALLALACGGYALPEGSVSEKELVDRLRGTQSPDGGFGEAGVPNMTSTAKAVTAFAYYKQYEGVTEAVNNGGGYMVVRLAENGSFPAEQGDVVPVTAQCVTALSVNGFDPTQLTEEAPNTLGYLNAAQNPDGGFGSYVGAGSDRSITIKATIAAYAYTQRALNVFNFSKDLSATMPEKSQPEIDVVPPQPETPPVTEPPQISDEKFPIDIKTVAIIFVVIAIIGAGVPILIIKSTRK